MRRSPLALVLVTNVAAFAVDPSIDVNPIKGISHTDLGLNNLWIVIGAVLVIFMQAGFALVETGFCRAKHAAHVVSTNFAIFGLGFVAFFLVGFPIMFSGFSYPGYFGLRQAAEPRLGSSASVTGTGCSSGAGAASRCSGVAYSVPVAAFFLYMVAFMDTTATIPTGAMAERWKWKAFVGWGLFCGALYYPIFGGWTWGGGWLSQLGNNLDLGFGYVDFAGSGVVHAMGGIAGLAGALVLGARIGKYGPDGKPRTLAAHNIPMAMLGHVHPAVRVVRVQRRVDASRRPTCASPWSRSNTAIAAAFGATIAMFYCMKRMGKPDPGMMANGMLAGLVAITAPCAFVQPWAAAVIGSIAAVHRRRVGVLLRAQGHRRPGGCDLGARRRAASSVCSASASSPTAATAPAGTSPTRSTTNGKGVTGILYGSGKFLGSGSFGKLGFGQLGSQAIGALVIIFVMGGIAYVFFKIQNALMKGGIRSDRPTRRPGSTCRRWACSPTTTSRLRELDIVGRRRGHRAQRRCLAGSVDRTVGT